MEIKGRRVFSPQKSVFRYNFPKLCSGKWMLGFSDHFARGLGSTFVLLQTTANTTNKTRYLKCAAAPKRKRWASPAYSTFITQQTTTNKKHMLARLKILIVIGWGVLLARTKMVQFIAAVRLNGKWLMSISERRREVSGCSVCLSTHVVRASLLMSDNVTLQNTSLWFSMIVFLNPF